MRYQGGDHGRLNTTYNSLSKRGCKGASQQGAGEPAGKVVVSTIACLRAGTVFFRAFDFRYLSDNFVADAPVKAVLPGSELYVNCRPPAWHNGYCNATRRDIVLDVASVIEKYGCSQRDGMC
jgi:hypothetical protein